MRAFSSDRFLSQPRNTCRIPLDLSTAGLCLRAGPAARAVSAAAPSPQPGPEPPPSWCLKEFSRLDSLVASCFHSEMRIWVCRTHFFRYLGAAPLRLSGVLAEV